MHDAYISVQYTLLVLLKIEYCDKMTPLTFILPLCSRIPKDCYGHSNWIRHHGLHWILCQTHPHPHQQHHCVSLFM